MKELNNYKSLWAALAFLLVLPGLTLLGQEEEEGGDDAAADGGDAGGGDAGGAAEGAVTSGSVSQPAAANSGAIESNPMVTLVRTGEVTFNEIKTLSISNIVSLALAGDGDITKLIGGLEQVAAGKSVDDVASALEAGVDPAAEDADFLISLSTLTGTNSDLYTAAVEVAAGAATGYDATSFQTALEAAVSVATGILTDKTITSAADLPATLTSSDLASGHNAELVRLLAKYGAIGSSSHADIDAIASSFFGSGYDYTAFAGSALLSDVLGATTSDHVGQLKGALGTRTLPTAVQNSSVLKVSMSNVTLAPAANIAISSGASIDVSDYLGAATPASPRKVYVLGAAKDLTIAGDVTFTNTNTAEDHALVIGAADDLYFRSEYSTANSADYADPDPITVKYEGSNLGIGSYDTMRLVNVNMETGGNLALGTLDELHISTSSTRENSTFTVGNGGNSPDNVYLYANDLIQVNGLTISGKVDDVYMDAVTINLNNVTFPASAEVMLRSQDGTLSFADNPTTTHKGVNLTNVVHQGIGSAALQQTDFDAGAAGHINSNERFENNTPMIRIRGF